VLVNAAESRLVSTLGWVDGAALWVCDPATGRTETVPLGVARYLTLHAGREDRFAVVHHFDGERLEVSVRTFDAPSREAAHLVLAPPAPPAFDGDPTAWALVPRAYTAYLRHPADDFYLVLVDRRGPAVAVETLPWYDETYDKGYQGVIGVTEVPDADLLIVCVQRDSEPVLWDPVARRVVRKLRLAGRLGNPTCRFRRTAPELWVDDYDMLLRVDPVDWSVTGTRGLQRAARGARQFIGAFAFNRDETLCAVARPFSGDVVAVDTRRLRVTHRARVGRQPLEVALLADGRVFARDWRTGDLLSGRLRRRLLTLP